MPTLARLATLFLLLVFGTPCRTQAVGLTPLPPITGAPLGVNLSWWTSFSPEWVFVDAWRGASEWVSQRPVGGPWDTGEPIALDSHGYPTWLNANQVVAAVMYKGLDGRFPGGRYVVLWDGDGDVEVKEDASMVSRNGNRIEADVTPGDGVVLRILRTNPSDPVRNIRVILPGFESTYQTQPFHPRFLANWRGFRMLRFMDWMRTNGSLQAQWADRPTLDDCGQASDKGVALELMIALCNQMHADPWFCLPHLASDDYVRQFARKVSQLLEPGRKVILEYSNECWNGGFEQARYCQREGVRLQLSNDPFEAQLRFYSQHAVELFRIARQELAGTHEVVRVLSAQNVTPWVATTMADWRSAFQELDAVAVAPYFGYELGDPSRQWEVSQWSVDQVLAECWNDLGPTLRGTRNTVAAMRQRGLEVLGYEGGQHLVGFGGAENNTQLTSLFIAANRDPRMFLLYMAFLDGWTAAGGGAMAAYYSTGRPGRYGSWGALEWAEQDPYTAPKYLALRLWVDGARFGR
ncbi:MAG: hypothetical protein R3F56_19070 [Planctomycetota bacterium]